MKQVLVLAVIALTGCASADVIRTSQDTAIVQASAAPVCGGIGAAKVAQKQAAKATLQAGYDRYILTDGSASNNIRTYQTPGSYQTTGTLVGNQVYANTTYTPGASVVTGTHNQALAVKMFKEGQPGSSNALSARETLGPNWEKEMTRQTLTCGDS